ncbi:MAG: fumarate hydratase [Deltaproteobacteria bacterium]|nr:fumarate hydratase [Deltaproteobacteria bacterium]
MSGYQYSDPYPLSEDKTSYRLLTTEHVRQVEIDGDTFLKVQPEALELLAREAMREVSFFLRPAHQEKVAGILRDPEASLNDRFVARTMLLNSVVAAEGQLPTCQDTGTATVVGKRGHRVITSGHDAAALSAGIHATYAKENLRYSQVAPLTMYKEKNTGDNMPAQVDLYAVDGAEYKFLFVAKGGGSANKMYLYQQTKALLTPEKLIPFLVEKMRSLGTAACPPYHIAFVIGGTSAETTLKMVKLASAGELDGLPSTGDASGRAFRDLELEATLLEEAQKLGVGAQFGGKYFAHDVRVVRLPRHGASLPVGLGVSCSADRNIKAKINHKGVWLEEMDHDPARWLAGIEYGETPGVSIDLNQPMSEVLAELSKHPVSTRLSLNGTLIVARDMAHLRLAERLERGEGLPDYLKKHPVYYAGPAKKPEGMASGSFGPTTAQRMDPYVGPFQAEGASMIMIAKGNRGQEVTDACKTFGGFYLGSVGGPAAILAQRSITSVEVLDMEELGMEAVWKIEVKDFPAFILVDDKGNDFFKR